MIIISSGKKNLDIDAYASGICYAHLLNCIGEKAEFVTTANYNTSICELIKGLNFEVKNNYKKNGDDKFVLLDVSDPCSFDDIVEREKIVNIIDHHKGHEKEWKFLGEKSQIEMIGSVATLIFEKFVEEKKENILTQDMCKLLIAGILDNTLNLKSTITTKRDIESYKKLQEMGNLTDEFDREYFASCDKEIEKDILGAIEGDIRGVDNNRSPKIFGQLLMHDISKILDNIDKVANFFENKKEDWILNLISIKDGKSYIFSTSSVAKEKIESLLGQKFNGDFLILEPFKLRKEILFYAYS